MFAIRGNLKANDVVFDQPIFSQLPVPTPLKRALKWRISGLEEEALRRANELDELELRLQVTQRELQQAEESLAGRQSELLELMGELEGTQEEMDAQRKALQELEAGNAFAFATGKEARAKEREAARVVLASGTIRSHVEPLLTRLLSELDEEMEEQEEESA